MNDMDNQNDILEIMSKKEYLETIFVIANNLNGVICNIINKTLHPQLMSLAKTKGLELSFAENNGWNLGGKKVSQALQTSGWLN